MVSDVPPRTPVNSNRPIPSGIAALAVACLLSSILPSTSLAAEGKDTVTVERIVVEGAKGREEAIKSQMRIREGDSYDPAEFRKLLNLD
ncbi:MAG: POTRA domain-containing protein, partial [Planctomycetota bacterium]